MAATKRAPKNEVRAIMCDTDTRQFLTNLLGQLQINPSGDGSEKVCQMTKNLLKQLADAPTEEPLP
jgi:hypothetical protein